MPQKTVRIVNRRGLHARAAAKFVRTVEQYPDVQVTVHKDGAEVPGGSIMGLLMLAAGKDTSVTIFTVGDAADSVLLTLSQLVESGFGEAD